MNTEVNRDAHCYAPKRSVVYVVSGGRQDSEDNGVQILQVCNSLEDAKAYFEKHCKWFGRQPVGPWKRVDYRLHDHSNNKPEPWYEAYSRSVSEERFVVSINVNKHGFFYDIETHMIQ